MRSDYALYTVAIIFFVLTGVAAAYTIEQQQLWIVTTAVLGLAFIGLGYSQRPKTAPVSTAITTTTPTPIVPQPPPAPTSEPEVKTQETIQETVQEVTAQPLTETATAIVETGLTKVKGIGEKRQSQLKELGINSMEDLAKASAKDLAAKLKISPKITGKWIENAKGIVEKSS